LIELEKIEQNIQYLKDENNDMTIKLMNLKKKEEFLLNQINLMNKDEQ
jgi:hypothetical protein